MLIFADEMSLLDNIEKSRVDVRKSICSGCSERIIYIDKSEKINLRNFKIWFAVICERNIPETEYLELLFLLSTERHIIDISQIYYTNIRDAFYGNCRILQFGINVYALKPKYLVKILWFVVSMIKMHCHLINEVVTIFCVDLKNRKTIRYEMHINKFVEKIKVSDENVFSIIKHLLGRPFESNDTKELKEFCKLYKNLCLY